MVLSEGLKADGTIMPSTNQRLISSAFYIAICLFFAISFSGRISLFFVFSIAFFVINIFLLKINNRNATLFEFLAMFCCAIGCWYASTDRSAPISQIWADIFFIINGINIIQRTYVILRRK
jgi:hypothetical protein